MNKKIWLYLVVLLFLASFVSAIPGSWYGYVTWDGSTAADGVVVDAYINSAIAGTATVGSVQSNGYYLLHVTGNSGDSVSFKIYGNNVTQAAQSWAAGFQHPTFNLTATSTANNGTCPTYTGYTSGTNVANLGCAGGYCVHSYCRAASTYCGDSQCDTGESCSSCATDCGSCGGGGSSGSSSSSTTTPTEAEVEQAIEEIIEAPPAPADTDLDGHPDSEDAFPNDATEWQDSDGDSVGNNADPDDDGDGFSDLDELAAGTDPLNANSKPQPQIASTPTGAAVEEIKVEPVPLAADLFLIVGLSVVIAVVLYLVLKKKALK